MKNLETLINEYGILNKDLNTLKKSVDGLNKKIKAEMKEREITDLETDSWKVKYQIRKSESLDEDKVISILKDSNLAENIVKYKPYIDEEALESAIYTGVLPKEVLLKIQDCKTVKETVALVIKENK